MRGDAEAPVASQTTADGAKPVACHRRPQQRLARTRLPRRWWRRRWWQWRRDVRGRRPLTLLAPHGAPAVLGCAPGTGVAAEASSDRPAPMRMWAGSIVRRDHQALPGATVP